MPDAQSLNGNLTSEAILASITTLCNYCDGFTVKLLTGPKPMQ